MLKNWIPREVNENKNPESLTLIAVKEVLYGRV
jgi:hypothetical protein